MDGWMSGWGLREWEVLGVAVVRASCSFACLFLCLFAYLCSYLLVCAFFSAGLFVCLLVALLDWFAFAHGHVCSLACFALLCCFLSL